MGAGHEAVATGRLDSGVHARRGGDLALLQPQTEMFRV